MAATKHNGFGAPKLNTLYQEMAQRQYQAATVKGAHSVQAAINQHRGNVKNPNARMQQAQI